MESVKRQVPQYLAKSTEAMTKFTYFCHKYLGPEEVDVKTITDPYEYYTIYESSGFSNAVFIVGRIDKNIQPKKIIVRFFLSVTSDYVFQNKVFSITSSKGICPNMLETDDKTYRIEECYDGGPYIHLDLAKKKVIDQAITALCDFNYDEDLNRLGESQKQLRKVDEFIQPGK